MVGILRSEKSRVVCGAWDLIIIISVGYFKILCNNHVGHFFEKFQIKIQSALILSNRNLK